MRYCNIVWIDDLDRYEWRLLNQYLNTIVTEIEPITGNAETAKIVEKACHLRLLAAQSDADYFSALENKTIKNAETKLLALVAKNN